MTVVIPVLETPTLRLRGAEMRDFDAWAAFRASDRAIHLGGPNTRGEAFEKLGEMIGHWQLRGYGRWVVTARADDTALGVVGLYYPPDWPEPEVAWSVFEQAEGRGVAHEAACAARDYAYDTLGWTTAISAVAPDNDRSAALARRMGAAREGQFTSDEGTLFDIWRHPAPEARA